MGRFMKDLPVSAQRKTCRGAMAGSTRSRRQRTATAGEIVAYLQFLNCGVGPRGRVLSEDRFQLLVQPVIKAPFRGEDASYSYGLWIKRDRGQHALARHTGGMVAFSSAMHADLTRGLGVFASVNANLAWLPA